MIAVLIGVAVGIIGSLSGAGGGFLLMPIFLIGMTIPHPTASGISLIAVTVNALVGTLIQFKKKRIEFETGVRVALAAYPGAIIGARLVPLIPEHSFHVVMGVFLGLFSIWMIVSAFRKLQASPLIEREGRFFFEHTHFDRAGNSYTIRYHLPTILGVSVVLGLLSSMLGIGGGPLLVPILLYLCHFPYPIVAPTSQFIILLTSIVGALVYVIQGHMDWSLAGWISLGVAFGAPIGIWFSTRIGKKSIVVLVATVLAATGIRMTFF